MKYKVCLIYFGIYNLEFYVIEISYKFRLEKIKKMYFYFVYN